MQSIIPIMRKPSTYALLFILILLQINGCKKGDSARTCMITHISDSTPNNYDYAYSNGSIKSITSNYLSNAYQRIDFTYDSKHQLEQADYKNISSGTETLAYSVKFVNGTNGKPMTMGYYFPNATDPYQSFSFIYDASGRLSQRELTSDNDLALTRYEYDNKNNVTKIYYTTGTIGALGQEELGRENTSFDNHPRFYAGSPGLDIVEIFLFGYDPSKNNVLHSTVNKPNALSTFIPAVEVDFSLAYSSDGMVTTTTGGYGIVEDLNFLSATYNCH